MLYVLDFFFFFFFSPQSQVQEQKLMEWVLLLDKIKFFKFFIFKQCMAMKYSSVEDVYVHVIFAEILSEFQALIPLGKFIVTAFSLKR